METKLICGIRHTKRPCLRCKGMIWTRCDEMGLKLPICKSCRYSSKDIHLTKDTSGCHLSDRQYNGECRD